MGNSVITNKYDIDYDKWFNFIKDNIYDLPFYKKNKWDYSQSKLETFKENKEWIYDTYVYLVELYAEKATDTIIDYVNKHFQAGSNEITSDTLDFIVSIFGEIIIHEFGTTNFTIIRLKEILKEKFVSERYRDVARLIFKEPTLNLPENSRVKYKFSSINSSNKKKWTDLYEQEDYDRWFTIIEENIYDLPYYKKNKWKFGPEILKTYENNKRWIFKTYEDLSYLYAENATDIIINYVNKHFQDGSTQIMRGTLDFIVSLFGENIIEEFVDRDFSINHLKQVLKEQLVSERYEDVARLISKEPGLNLSENTRVKYEPRLTNSLNSKRFSLNLINLSDPFSFGEMKHEIGKSALKATNTKVRQEINTYEKILKKDWSLCLPNERQRTLIEWFNKEPHKCIPLKYIRKNITDVEMIELKKNVLEINMKIVNIQKTESSDFKINKQKILNIIKSYNFCRYIDTNNLNKLKEYGLELKLTMEESITKTELCFMIIIQLFPDFMIYMKKIIPGYLLDHIENLGSYYDVIFRLQQAANLVAPYKLENFWSVMFSLPGTLMSVK